MITTQPTLRCVVCESTEKVEMNHIGGRNFIAWLTMPFCGEHHARFHVLLQQAGIDLRYTSDPIERARRALAAIKIAEWMILEMIKEELNRRNHEN
jgi:hypothetical protein